MAQAEPALTVSELRAITEARLALARYAARLSESGQTDTIISFTMDRARHSLALVLSLAISDGIKVVDDIAAGSRNGQSWTP
jgi:hypothetical protein